MFLIFVNRYDLYYTSIYYTIRMYFDEGWDDVFGAFGLIGLFDNSFDEGHQGIVKSLGCDHSLHYN